MKYPDDFINKVIQGDCLEVMKHIPDKAVDLVLTDPPYGLGIDKAMGKCANTQYGNGAAKKKDYGNTDWDAIVDERYIYQLLRCSGHQIIFGGNYYADKLPPSRNWIIWDKKTDDKYKNDFADCEIAWVSIDGVARIFRYIWHGMIQADMKNKDYRQHPTQKPLKLMKWCIEKYTDPNNLILDPFLGSGTTAVAAKALGRRFIGIEKEPKYCEIARQRLKAVQLEMFT